MFPLSCWERSQGTAEPGENVHRPARKISLEGNAAAGFFQDRPGSKRAPGAEAQPKSSFAAICRQQTQGPNTAQLRRKPRTLIFSAEGCPFHPENIKTSPLPLSKGRHLTCEDKGFARKAASPGWGKLCWQAPACRKPCAAWLQPRNTSEEHAGMFSKCPQRSTG